MRLIPWVFTALLFQTSVLASHGVSFSGGGRFALPARVGPALLKQCSRQAPEGATDFWQPSIAELDELERLLFMNLAFREKKGAGLPPKATYHRQYVGFKKGKVRYIYGNFYPDKFSKNANENGEPLLVCDGGPSFWGVVFRIDAKQFEELSFNGSV
jgi:hypothetical protein